MAEFYQLQTTIRLDGLLWDAVMFDASLHHRLRRLGLDAATPLPEEFTHSMLLVAERPLRTRERHRAERKLAAFLQPRFGKCVVKLRQLSRPTGQPVVPLGPPPPAVKPAPRAAGRSTACP